MFQTKGPVQVIPRIDGTQFKVHSFEEKAPEGEIAIERYLGSGAIKGIGIALAARIVRRFKEDTFRIIEEEPERLAEIKGISHRKAMEIADQVNAKKDLRQAMIFLQQYGITTNLAVKIYNTYEDLLKQKDAIIEKQDEQISNLLKSKEEIIKSNKTNIISLKLQNEKYSEIIDKLTKTN